MKNLINPNMLKAGYKRWNAPGFASGKFYIPVLIGPGTVLRTRRVFGRASEAEAYAGRIQVRWVRLFAATQSEPTPAENVAP